MVKNIRFIDPYGVGLIPSTKIDKKAAKEAVQRRASALAQALLGTLPNQIVLLPVNVG